MLHARISRNIKGKKKRAYTASTKSLGGRILRGKFRESERKNHDCKFGDTTRIARESRLDLQITFNNFILFSRFGRRNIFQFLS